MSEVYRGDTVIGRTVAVRLLTEAGCADADAKARFWKPAWRAHRARQTSSIYDFGGEDEGQRPYMVMEFLRFRRRERENSSGTSNSAKNARTRPSGC